MRAASGFEGDHICRKCANVHPCTRRMPLPSRYSLGQGANDPRVNKSESDQIVVALRDRKFPVEYLVAPDEGHGFAKKKNADFQFYSTVQFIREYLLK